MKRLLLLSLLLLFCPGTISTATAADQPGTTVLFGRASLRGLIRDPADPAGPLDEALFTLEFRTGGSEPKVMVVLPVPAPLPGDYTLLIGTGGRCVIDGDQGAPSHLAKVVATARESAVSLSGPVSIEASGRRIRIGRLTILSLPREPGPAVGTRCRAIEEARSGGPVVLVTSPDETTDLRFALRELDLEAALPRTDFPVPPPPEKTEKVRGWLPGRYRVDRVWYRTPRPSGVEENDLYPIEYFIPKRKAVAAMIVLPMWKGGSLIAERMVAGDLAAFGYLVAVMPLPYQFQRAPKGVRSGSWTASEDFDRTKKVMVQALAEIEEMTTRLAARPDVTGGRVGILGISLGAHVAAAAYQRDPRLKAGVFVMAGGDLASLLFREVRETRRMREAIRRQGLTREEVEEKLLLLDPARAQDYPVWPCFPRYRGVLMINATKDLIVPPENARALHRALGRPKIQWYPEDHYSMALRFPQILRVVREHLRGLFR